MKKNKIDQSKVIIVDPIIIREGHSKPIVFKAKGIPLPFKVSRIVKDLFWPMLG